MRSSIVALLAVCGLAILPASALATAAYPSSQLYGGPDHRVDTDSEVNALLTSQKTKAQLSATIDGLSPADRKFVVARGLTTARVVDTVVNEPPTPTPLASTLAPCGAWSEHHRFYSDAYAYTGLHEFNYFSDWSYGGACWVHGASHWEDSSYQMIGWSYDGRIYGNAYGSLDSPMVGRETIGHFTWAKFALHGQLDQQVKVTGCWGQWGCGGYWVWSNHSGA